MDGPVSSSGGYEAGGAFVTIGANLEQLRAAETEAAQVVERIGRMSANVSFAGGASAGTPTLFGAAAGNGGNTPAYGATYGPLAAVSAAQNHIDAIRAAGGTAAVVGSAVTPSFTAPELMAEAGTGTPSFGSAGGRGFNAAYTNLFGIRGLGRMMGNVTAAYGIYEGLRLAESFASAAQLDNPDRVLAGMYSPGMSIDPTGDAMYQQFSGRQAMFQSRLEFRQSVNSSLLGIPGLFDSLGNAMGDSNSTASMQMQSEALGRQMSSYAYVQNAAAKIAVQSLQIGGDPIGAMQLQAAQGQQALLLAAYRSGDPNAMNVVAQQSLLDENRIGIASGVRNAELNQLTGAGSAALLQAAGISMVAARLPGSGPAALMLSQEAERQAFGNATTLGSAQLAGDLPKQLAYLSSRSGERELMMSRQQAARAGLDEQIRNQWIGFTAAGNAAAVVGYDPFAARQIELDADFEQGLPQAELNGNGAQFRFAHAMRSMQIGQEQYQSDTLAFGRAQDMEQAARFRMSRNSLGLALLPLQSAAREAQFLPVNQQPQTLAGIIMQGQATIAEDQRHQFMLKEEYTARASVAQAIVNDQPINAQAIAHVAAATLEVQRADPRNRAQAVATAQEELRATWHDTVAQRGGGVAIDMGAGFAAGLPGMFGLDLTNRRADQMAAAGTFKSGISGLPGAAAAADGQNVSDDQAHQLLSTIAGVLQQMLQKGGPALFAN